MSISSSCLAFDKHVFTGARLRFPLLVLDFISGSPPPPAIFFDGRCVHHQRRASLQRWRLIGLRHDEATPVSDEVDLPHSFMLWEPAPYQHLLLRTRADATPPLPDSSPFISACFTERSGYSKCSRLKHHTSALAPLKKSPKTVCAYVGIWDVPEATRNGRAGHCCAKMNESTRMTIVWRQLSRTLFFSCSP